MRAQKRAAHFGRRLTNPAMQRRAWQAELRRASQLGRIRRREAKARMRKPCSQLQAIFRRATVALREFGRVMRSRPVRSDYVAVR